MQLGQEQGTKVVRIKPLSTLGKTSIGGTTDNQNGTLVDIQAYLNNAGAKVAAGIYNDTAGSPSSLVAITSEVTLTAAQTALQVKANG